MKNSYPFPIYATQGGGIVREVNGIFIFVEPPEQFPEMTVGSEMPAQWDIIPANDLAAREENDLFW